MSMPSPDEDELETEFGNLFEFEFTPCCLTIDEERDNKNSRALTVWTRRLSGWLTWSNLRRLVLMTTISVILSLFLLLSSTVAYFIFYQTYMPVANYSIPVYFQYGEQVDPWASVPSGFDLRKGIAYDFFLDLKIPDVPGLADRVGNFMVSFQIKEHTGGDWTHTHRPALLPFRSTFLRGLTTALTIVPLLLGWVEESIIKRVCLQESLRIPKNSWQDPVELTIRIGSKAIPIQEARLLITAHMTGLRYAMYHWRVTTAVLAIGLLTLVQMLGFAMMYLTWRLVRIHGRGDHPVVANIPTLKANGRHHPKYD